MNKSTDTKNKDNKVDNIEKKIENISNKINEDSENKLDLKLKEFKDIVIKDIISKYNANKKKVKYGDIYGYIYSKNSEKRIWPSFINIIKCKKERDNQKINFKKACKNFYIDTKNNRLYQKTYIIDTFNNQKRDINVLIILEEEKIEIMKIFHIKYGHIGINRLNYEIFRHGYYWNNMSIDISNYIKRCVICNTHKLGKKIKPNNKQIISYFPLERVELDLTYLSKLYPKNNSEFNYLLCAIDHFSKYAKTYLMKTKSSEEVLKYLKSFINEIGTPHIIQTDNGGEFTAKIIKNYLKEKKILFINSSAYHPQTNGVVEAFNKYIIYKLEYTLLDDKNNFDIVKGIEKANEIYNNTIHTTTRIEPIKAIKFTDEEDINNLIANVIKSQKNKILKNNVIQKGEKCLLSDLYIIKNNSLKMKFNKIGKYRIPILIQEPLGGTNYSFSVTKDICDLKSNIIYKADYRLIKRCCEEVWEFLLSEINNDIINN